MELRGFYTPGGYKGWVKNKYKLFATEEDYEDYMRENTPKGVGDEHFTFFLDTQGIFGDVNDIINEGDIIDYWNNNHTSDPVLRQYRTFQDWWKATRQYLHEL